MSILFILIIISLTVASGFLIAFFWAVRNGQFEDDFTPSVRILFDDEDGIDDKMPEVEEDKANSASGTQEKEKININEK